MLAFRDSARLTSAYGIAVGLTMLITTVQMVSLSRNVGAGRGPPSPRSARRSSSSTRCWSPRTFTRFPSAAGFLWRRASCSSY
ncbi:MAG: Kup system potassium uptake protein [uncultured Caballeronia sp.]|nr:MAG: Kup system potassium uptake protein [uncultured Caballeronia sp.]